MTGVRSHESLGISYSGLFLFEEVQIMSKDKITYSDVIQQIKKLKAQGLTILDEDFAAKTLRTWGYSNLIKSYRDPYVITINDHKAYRNGVTFEQIYSLYLLDKNLRNAVIASMLDLEEHIKTITADVISCDFGIHHEKPPAA